MSAVPEAYVSGSTSGNNPILDVSITVTATSNVVVIAGVLVGTEGPSVESPSSVVFDPTGLNVAMTHVYSGGLVNTYQYIGPAPGTYNIEIQATGTDICILCCAASVTNASQSGGSVNRGNGSNTGTAASFSASGFTDWGWCSEFFGASKLGGGAITFAVGAGQDIRTQKSVTLLDTSRFMLVNVDQTVSPTRTCSGTYGTSVSWEGAAVETLSSNNMHEATPIYASTPTHVATPTQVAVPTHQPITT